VSHEVLLANANTALLTQSYLEHSCFCTITVLGFPVPNYAFKDLTTLAPHNVFQRTAFMTYTRKISVENLTTVTAFI